jgi:uncharacterized membrane protein
MRVHLEEAPRGKPRPRIESLSDLVFGLALSIGAIALVSSPPTTNQGFYKDIATFGFNFVILISIWLRYTRVMSVLPVETRGTLMLNGILLFTVALEPFIYNILRSGNSALKVSASLYEAASSSFGLDVGAMMLIMGVFTLTLADEERRLVPGGMTKGLRSEALGWFIAAGIFLVSAVPLFGRVNVVGTQVTGVTVRSFLWLLALLVSWVRSGIRGVLEPEEKPSNE